MKAAFAAAGLMLLAAKAAAAPPVSERPGQRPAVTTRVAEAVALPPAPEAVAVARSPRPADRPAAVRRPAPQEAREPVRTAAVRGVRAGMSARGRLCGVRGIEGERIAPIPGRLPGCGLRDGVLVRAVDGVSLSRPARIDCPTARALHAWVRGAVKPAIGRRGGGVAELRVVGHYVCRTRNHRPGAKVSEHGKGRAIDIGGITLKNGAQVNVATGWNDRTQGPILRAMHRGACGPFGTVLGPDSDRHHKAHFHLDTARYRSGPYCR